MALNEVSFLSYNERDYIKGWVYTPIVEPKGIIQITHGLGEHSRRYMHMILRFLDAGYIVAADDHVGHGKTALDSDTWGDYGDKGYMTTTEDEHALHCIVRKKYPNLPYFHFGHSWGSMITRNYVTHYGDDVSGAVFCGTGRILQNAVDMYNALERQVADGYGKEVEPTYMNRIFQGMTERYDHPITPNDWISITPEVVADHGKDPLNNKKILNVQSVFDFVKLVKIVCDDSWFEKVPKKLPTYNIGGDQDPVTNYGEGIYYVANHLIETGHRDTTVKVYPGYRHEIHNEPAIRDEVVDGIIAFFDSHLPA